MNIFHCVSVSDKELVAPQTSKTSHTKLKFNFTIESIQAILYNGDSGLVSIILNGNFQCAMQ